MSNRNQPTFLCVNFGHSLIDIINGFFHSWYLLFSSGYIPKGQHYYGDRYAEIALNAISDFEQDQIDHRVKIAAMTRLRDVQEGRDPPNDKERKVSGIKITHFLNVTTHSMIMLMM